MLCRRAKPSLADDEDLQLYINSDGFACCFCIVKKLSEKLISILTM